MQRACQNLNVRRLPEEQVLFCVGIGFGRILRIGDVDVFGAEVNAASKLGEDIAKADQILVTRAACEAAGDLEGLSYLPIETSVPESEKNFEVRYSPLGSSPPP